MPYELTTVTVGSSYFYALKMIKFIMFNNNE